MRFTQIDLSGKRVLVTGGTGFIGSRLVERLVLKCNANVRVLMRNFARAIRIARFPIEMVHGDVSKPDDVERAVSGCEVIFHCAYGNQGGKEIQRLVNVEGTKNVLSAALHAGVKRIVHLSTFTVYGATQNGDLDETAPRCYSGNVYTDSKLDAEKIAFDYVEKHGLPVAVIQPTAVYGPFAPVWTVNVLRQIRTGRIILVNGGDGLRNVVYIDDIVSAILLAAVKEEAIGEAFLISGEDLVTYRNFYNRFEHMLGISGTVSMSAAEAETYYASKQQKSSRILSEILAILREEPAISNRLRKTVELAILGRVVRSVLPDRIWQSLKRRISGNGRTGQPQIAPEGDKPIHPLGPVAVRFSATKVRVRIDKAKEILGYQPVFNFDSGMRLTEQWARWANLLGE